MFIQSSLFEKGNLPGIFKTPAVIYNGTLFPKSTPS